MSPIWLVGMMGSGKTTAGAKAAPLIGVSFFDTDELISEHSGKPIHELWAEVGEIRFRSLEREIVSDLSSREGLVATGGGVVIIEENRDTLASTGPVIWLRASVGALAERLAVGHMRPLLSGDEHLEVTLRRIATERESMYAAVATDVIETDDLTIDEVVTRLVEVCGR